MPKSPLEKTIEKQMKESQKQARDAKRQAEKEANDAARRERARTIIDGQPTVNGLRILDANAEELLRIILNVFDGNDSNWVSLSSDKIPQNLFHSLNLELEKLMMYGVATNAFCYLSGECNLHLTQQGKTYFDDKENATKSVDNKQGFEMSLTRKQYDVFISHASKDKLAYVDALYMAIRKLGINIFYDTEEITWGDNWKQVILNGVAKSEFAVVVISKEFFGREWTERELNDLLQRQNENGQKIILPLLYNLSRDELKEQYPELEFIQSIENTNNSLEEIVVLLAKELIKRYK